MKYRALLVLPWVLAAVAALLFVAVVPDHRDIGRTWNAIIKGGAAIGCFLAYASYGRGDYLRVGWAALGISFVAISVRDFLSVGGLLGTSWVALNVPQIVANGFGVAGSAYFALAFRVAGLEHPVARGTKIGVYLACSAVALSIAGVAIVEHIAALGRTDIGVVGAFASDFADLASLVLLAPMLLTTLALRGGLLGRPWLMLTAAQIFWLVYDVLAFANWVAAREMARTLACVYSMCAGLAQWGILRAARDGLPAARDDVDR